MLTACGVPCEPEDSYELFGAGFLTENCTACHSSTTLDRWGAPESFNFDGEEDIERHRDAILRTVVDQESMPPGGGVDPEVRARVAAWLDCTP